MARGTHNILINLLSFALRMFLMLNNDEGTEKVLSLKKNKTDIISARII